MVIETWIAIVIIVFVFAIGLISLIGWMAADERNEKERAISKELEDENEKLKVENAQLKAKLSFIKLRIDMEEKK